MMRQTISLHQDEPRLKGNRSLQTKITLILGLIVACSAAAWVSRAQNEPAAEPSHFSSKAAAGTAPSTMAAPATPRNLVTTIKFSLFDVGIYPREVHVDKGLIAITIEDYSGGSTGVIVDRETGAAPERAGRVDRAGPHWRSRGEMTLGPGRYSVYMADRPANQALLVVEP